MATKMHTKKELDNLRPTVNDLQQMVVMLGYNSLEDFFEDNSSAIESVMEWVCDREWKTIDETELCDDCNKPVDVCVCGEPTGDDDDLEQRQIIYYFFP